MQTTVSLYIFHYVTVQMCTAQYHDLDLLSCEGEFWV